MNSPAVRFVLLVVLLGFVAASFAQTCSAAPKAGGDRRTDKTRLRIAAFNVEWLFLYRSNCPGTGCTWETKARAEAHLASITDQLEGLNADVIVLPEVEDCRVLDLLATSLSGYRPYLVPGTDSATGQNVGLLTRVDPIVDLKRSSARYSYPVAGSKCGYKGTGDSAVSKHFYTVLPGGLLGPSSPPILLVGVHFIAFPLEPDRCAQRESQASVIRDIVTTEGIKKGYEVVVLGDMNDYERDFVDASGTAGVPLSRALDIIKGTDLDHFKVKLEAGLADSEKYSSWYDRNGNCKDDSGQEHTTIDHILFSKAFLKSKVRYARFHHSFAASCASLNSDHWPLYIELSSATTALGAADPVIPQGGYSQGGDQFWQAYAAIAFGVAVGVALVVLVVVLLLVVYKKI